jgi:hypothetical protein
VLDPSVILARKVQTCTLQCCYFNPKFAKRNPTFNVVETQRKVTGLFVKCIKKLPTVIAGGGPQKTIKSSGESKETCKYSQNPKRAHQVVKVIKVKSQRVFTAEVRKELS